MAETGEQVTYRQLEDDSIRLARVLHGYGLRRGDHLAFLSDNAPETLTIYWAALRSGLYVTGINHHLRPDEVAYIVQDCGARVLIVAAAKRELAEAVVALTPQIEHRLAFDGSVDGYDDYADTLAAQPTDPLPDQPRGADMLYSSGTTGRPKGIKPAMPDRQVHEPGDTYVAVFGPTYGFDEHTVYYSPAPIYHAAPLRFAGVVHALGGTVVMASRFEPENALAAIERYRLTHSQWVPTMFVRMLKLPDEVRERYDVSSLQAAIHAAAPCPVEVKAQMMRWWGPILHEYYASTEGNGVTLVDPQTWLAHPGTVGKAALGVIHVCDDDGAEVATGEVGTIFFERETAVFAYHNDPDRTREGRHPDHENWATAGDLGYLDDEGYLYLTDRKAFMIISGGVNIYPQEIEDAMVLHPAVADVAVIGVPDEDMGERVLAVVQPATDVWPGPDLAAELIDYTRGRIAHYKAPREIEFVDQLPRSATGKLVKRLLVNGRSPLQAR